MLRKKHYLSIVGLCFLLMIGVAIGAKLKIFDILPRDYTEISCTIPLQIGLQAFSETKGKGDIVVFKVFDAQSDALLWMSSNHTIKSPFRDSVLNTTITSPPPLIRVEMVDAKTNDSLSTLLLEPDCDSAVKEALMIYPPPQGCTLLVNLDEGLSCIQIFECLQSCAQTDPSCASECTERGTPQAQQQLEALAQCLQTTCADIVNPEELQQCVQQQCSSEISACQGSGTGGSGGGSNTSPGGWPSVTVAIPPAYFGKSIQTVIKRIPNTTIAQSVPMTIDTEIVAMSLQSVHPLQVPSFFDVFYEVTIDNVTEIKTRCTLIHAKALTLALGSCGGEETCNGLDDDCDQKIDEDDVCALSNPPYGHKFGRCRLPIPVTSFLATPDFNRNFTPFSQYNKSAWGNQSCGPTCAAVILQYWNRTGFPGIMGNVSIVELIDKLRNISGTNENGTSVFNLVEAITTHLHNRSFAKNFTVTVFEADPGQPDNTSLFDGQQNGVNVSVLVDGNFTFTDLLREMANETVILLVESSQGGHFVAANDYTKIANSDGSHNISIMDPAEGKILNVLMYDNAIELGDENWTIVSVISVSPVNALLDTDSDGIPDITEACVDNDHDGYGSFCSLGSDCDDSNVSIHPGALDTCDGIDDNCDGFVDDVPTQCGSDVGTCEFGVSLCVNGSLGVCIGYIGPIAEVCDGLDNDCDTIADESLSCPCINGTTKPCGSDVGMCQSGTQTCLNGTFEETCVGEVLPGIEVCNLVDDDCDGSTDEGDLCLSTCINDSVRPCGTDVGECAVGILTCINNTWEEICNGFIGPAPEVCSDSLDNDCDGVVNEFCVDV